MRKEHPDAPPSRIQMKDLKCTVCHGQEPAMLTCEHCMARGLEMIVGCPKKQTGPEVLIAIETAEGLKNGEGWPNGRGLMNESQSLVDAVRYARYCIDREKSNALKNIFGNH